MAKKQDILETALRLFEVNGYHAVGIDRIIAESGVAKMTMYKHFASKDDLVIEVLRERDRKMRESITTFVTRYKGSRSRAKAVFRWLEEYQKSSSSNGCLCINAVSEYGQHHEGIMRAAAEHKRRLEAFFKSILSESYPEPAGRLAHQMMLLFDGATVTGQISRRTDSAKVAWSVFERLL